MSYDSDVVSATSGRGEADWDKIITLCNRIRNSVGASSMQLAFEAVMRRLKNTDANVQLHTLTLLEACVSNCGSSFQIELTKPFFQNEVKSLLASHPDPKVSQRMKELLGSWVTEFRSNTQMKGLLAFVEHLRHEGQSFSAAQPQPSQPISYPADISSSASKEDSDLQKAIKMSLEESKKSSATPSSVYPVLSSSPKPQKKQLQQSKRVRALYDFQAAEDNELSFRAGEIITILDDSDENWWKGETHLGKGLFPANFVSSNLSTEPEHVKVEKENKKKEEPRKVMANEEKVDLLLQMLSTADATAETPGENETIIELEKECQAMKPSIEEAIAMLQRQEDDMKSVNDKFQDVMAYYRKLLAEGPRLSTLQSQRGTTVQQHQAPPQQYQAPPQHYQAPPQQYQAPPQQYQTPPQHYQAPPQQSQAPPPQSQAQPQQYQGSSQVPPQQYQSPSQFPSQQYQAPPTIQPSHSQSGGGGGGPAYQPSAQGSSYPSITTKVMPHTYGSPYLGEMATTGGLPPPQYTPYGSLPPSSGYQPSTTNQSLMTGSSSSNQQPLTGPSSLMQSATTGLNPQMMSSLNPATLSVMTAFPSQPMTGQLSGPASYNQPLMTGATSLPQQPPYYYQTPIASMQQPQPSLLH